MLRRERACLQKLKKIFSRQNGLVLLLVLVEFMVLALRFVGDFRTGGVIDITPDLIIPYAEECTNDDRGARVENFTGLFATTRWIDLPRGSYQVCINYVNDGEDGEVSFLDEIMPTAQYDAAKLPAERTRTVFSLWMPYGCETAQLQFTADCGKNQVIYITGAQIVPTHAWAYVRLLTGLVFCAVLDWVILLLTRRVKFPIHTLRGRYIAMALVGIGVFACLPLGLGYLTYGHDLSIHLSRIEGLKAGLLAGQFPVRMDPAIINEKGYPFSLMYSDVFLYPAAVLRILGFSLQTSYKVYVASITAATVGITFYALRKMFRSDCAALLGTALYTLSFYRLTNVFVRAAVGEYTAMAFLPLVVYGLWRIYRQSPADGKKAEPWCWLPFALGFTGNMVQANSISDAFHNAFGLPKLAVGLVTAAVAAFIFLGGVKRIAAVTEKLVPIMALFYIIGCVIILIMNASAIPNAFVQIFTLAFQPQAIAGGVAGVTVQQAMRYGVARGLFSNEAGLGSTPHAHALAKVKQPQDQGALAIIGVFVDTFVILTLTALVLITSGLIPEGMTGTALTQAAFSLMFGSFGKVFIAICMLFFAFSTILGWYFFGQVNFNALFGSKYTKVYSLIVVLFILIGSSLKVDLVWALADFFNGLMAVPNLLALLALSGVVAGIARNKKD